MGKSSGSALTSYSEDIHSGKESFSMRRTGLITKILELREDKSAEMLGNFQLRIAVVRCMASKGHSIQNDF